MASNIAVKITADVTDLTSQMAVARAELNATNTELRKLAQTAQQSGMTDGLKAQLTQAAEASVQAKTKVSALSAEMKALQPAAQEAGGALSGFHLGLGQVAEGLASLGLALSVERILEFGRAVEESTAQIAHEAKVLQLSTTAYQAFVQAGVDSGVSSEAADAALRKFDKSVGDAALGAGNGAKALFEMGISASQSREAILQQASAFLVHADANTQSRIATELFGKSGQEILPLLRLWADGVDNLTEKYRAQNRILNPETVEAAERADERMAAAATTLKVTVAPAVVGVTNLLSFLAKGFAGVATSAEDFAHGDMLKAVKDYWAVWSGGADVAAKVKPPPKPAAPTTQDELNYLKQLNPKIQQRLDLQKKLDDAKKIEADLPKGSDGYKQAAETVADLQKELDSLNKPEKVKFGDGSFKDAGAAAIAQARENISAINADQTKGDAERQAEIQKTYTDLLGNTKLNAAQRLEVEKSMNDALAAANRQAANEKRQIDQNDAQTGLRIAQIGFEQKKAILEEEVAAGKISKQEELAALIPILEAEKQAQLDVVTAAEKGYAADTVFFKEKENEKLVIVQQSENQIAQIRRQIQEQSARDEVTIEKRAYSEISSASDTLISGLLSGRQTLLQTLGQATLQFVTKEIQDDAKYFIAHALFSKQALASDQSIGQAGLLLHSLLENEKTASTVAGEAARTTAKETAKAAGSAADIASGSAEIMNSASKAAAGAYSAVAGIPIVGPVLAPIAAGTAFAAVAAFDTLTSLDTGTNMVPRDMPAYIHQGERVVPKADNAALMAALNGGGAGGGDSPVNFNYHAAPNPNADHQSNARDMLQMFNHQKRIGALNRR